MHEVSLIQALFDQADGAIAPHRPAAVRELRLRLGELAGVEPELLRVAFEGCKAERGYGGAALSLVSEPARFACAECGAEVPQPGPLRCARCSGGARLVTGDALILERIELEVSDV